MTAIVTHEGVDWALRYGAPGINEYRAYLVAQRHFGGVVPKTLPAITPQGRGSLQEITGETAHSIDDRIIDLTRTQTALWCLANIVGLDLVLGNADRHGNNWTLDSTGRIWAIDNENYDPGGITFQQALRPVYRADLILDVATPVLIAHLHTVLDQIDRYRLATPARCAAWLDDLIGWQERACGNVVAS